MHNYVVLYEHAYYKDSEIENGIVRRMIHYDYDRKSMARDTRYYMNCMTLHNNNNPIVEFKLGIDRSVPGYCIPDRCDNSLFLNFVIEGKGRLNSTEFQAGDFYYTVPMQKHSLYSDARYPWVTVWLQVTGSYAANLQKRLEALSPDGQKNSFHYPDTVFRLAECYLYECQVGNNLEQFENGIVESMLSYLSNQEKQPIALQNSFRNRKLIHRALDIIHTELSTVTVSSLSKRLHLDRRYFSQLFHSCMNLTPQQYIQDRKMDYIKNILITTPLSIDEIVEITGYGHRNTLTHAFRKQFGCSPSQYRKNYDEMIRHREPDGK